ncbi:MAG TPA: twin-arginine translocation signal domain-containing protein, partial [Thermoguttaceae bacterium]|nr:twin-arginine translocation signal domain-containing protein [Thermoguttaceae bacterium]
MWHGHRRDFLRTSAAMAAAGFSATNSRLWAQIPGERPQQDGSVEVLNPLDRVPVSMIIDDSTCLVNMARYAMPQFAEIWPDRDDYQKPWQNWPREIPDAFVRTFGSWCAEQGVKGKYSIVPYPALVGRLDRELPGWTKKQLDASLQLVRDLMVPNWDIHPEMITHTLAIDTKTGRPYPEHTQYYAENWRFTDGKSVDELADYLSYALQILKNVGLPCEGITTPGGFGSAVVPELAQATLESCRDVF